MPNATASPMRARHPVSSGRPPAPRESRAVAVARERPQNTVASMLARATHLTLGGYRTDEGPRERRILAVAVPDESVLVLDCEVASYTDARVLARIAPEEPPANAKLVAELYLADTRRGRSRAVTLADLEGSAAVSRSPNGTRTSTTDAEFAADLGRFQLRVSANPGRFPELRWMQLGERPGEPLRPITLRDVIGALERYQPAIAMTRSAIDAHPLDGALSTSTLRAELRRMESSSIVLNRALREAVDRALASGMSLSEIALRCGRIKRDCRGNVSGETSWLARRIGRLPEGGKPSPTPWVHTSTLALIAREGLRLSPREVEL